MDDLILYTSEVIQHWDYYSLSSIGLEWGLDLLETNWNKMKLYINLSEVLQEWAVQRLGRCYQNNHCIALAILLQKVASKVEYWWQPFLSQGNDLGLPETGILLQEDHGDKYFILFFGPITDTLSPLNCALFCGTAEIFYCYLRFRG